VLIREFFAVLVEMMLRAVQTVEEISRQLSSP
jgi:hypothetical protein